MNKAKSLLALALVAFVGVTGALAAPVNVLQRHDQANLPVNPLYGGYSHKRDSATGEMIVCSGRCLLAAITMGTGPTSSTVQLRNSSVADGSGALVIWRRFEVAQSGYSQANMVPLPILLNNGITVQLPSASSGEEVTVEYLDLNNP